MSATSPPRTALAVIGGLWTVFFFLGMSPGYYTPALSNILGTRGLGSDWVAYAFLVGPVAALISPLIVGSIADNRFAAQKVFAVIGMASAVLLASAFAALERFESPYVFLGLFAAASVVAAPMWSMVASISMVHLRSGEREFPVVRLGGTLGWMAAGVLTSFVFLFEGSIKAGYAAAITRFIGAAFAFLLPNTPPVGNSRSLRTMLGLDAFRLLRERDHLVFFSVTALLSIPLAVFFMHTPMHLTALGNTAPSATMTIGQISEIAAMLLMSVVMSRFRVKTVLMFAVALSALRYGLFAISGSTGNAVWLVGGIALHGLCYTLYFITGQLFLDRRVDPSMRTQAQGLLTLVNNGIGSVVGTIFGKFLYDYAVLNGNGGWATYWWVQTALIAICLPVLWFFYHGVVAKPAEPVAELDK
ncbi:MFS transporter [Luteolibacter flavescens]|uniref:MFS transporter n=1 Tax=Luteolibacter flavescens TaxID=1859460 RepID=A0ABT3FN95_9BACT|nr:MFS transporter [Luteolibacter flavescens]MCW1884674.1 MFS transporter [Luteolibacter flavescens]